MPKHILDAMEEHVQSSGALEGAAMSRVDTWTSVEQGGMAMAGTSSGYPHGGGEDTIPEEDYHHEPGTE